MSTDLPPLRPYLLRALHRWMEDCGRTPHLLVDVNAAGLEAPTELAVDGMIQFNLASQAVRGLEISNEAVDFEARFSGVSRSVHVPMAAVLGILTREDAQGMLFNDSDFPAAAEKPADDEASATPEHGTGEPQSPPARPGKPDLKLIK